MNTLIAIGTLAVAAVLVPLALVMVAHGLVWLLDRLFDEPRPGGRR